MHPFILLAANTSNSGATAWPFVVIGLFFLAALVLAASQYLNLRKYDHENLSSSLRSFVERSGSSDENILLDFTDDYFLQNMLKYDEIIRFLLTSLTILGLLGTFIGMSMVIPQISTLLGSGVEASKATMRNITGGFETAFYSSIVGIILALVSSLFYHFYRQRVKKLRASFVDQYLPLILKASKKEGLKYDPAELYQEIQTYFINGLQEFQRLNLESHNKLQTWAEGVVSSHTAIVKEYVDTTNKKIDSVTSELSKEYNALKSIAKENSKVAGILDKVVSKLDSFADVIQNYDKTYESLLATIGEFSQNFGDLFSDITTVVDRINQPSLLLSNLYTGIQEMVNNQNLSLSSNKEVMDTVIKQFEELLQSNADTSLASLNELKQYLQSFLTTFQGTISHESLQELLSPQTQQILESLATLNLELTTLKTSQDGYSDRIEAINGKVSSLSDSVKSITGIIGMINQLSEQMDKINRNLGKVMISLLEG